MYPKEILDPDNITIYPELKFGFRKTTYFAIKDEVVDIILNGQRLE